MFLLTVLLFGCNGEDECTDWFCEDGNGGATTTDGKGGSTKSGTKSGTKTGTKTETSGFTVSLEVSTIDGLGQLWIDGDDGCVSSLSIDSATARTDCAACDLAFDMHLGLGGTDAVPCAIEDDWAGTNLQLGHADPASLFFYKTEWEDGGGFGTSTVTGQMWTVEMPAF